MEFEIVGPVSEVETIAVGRRIRDIDWLKRAYGPGTWRKLKGVALVRLLDSGEVFRAEIHWYEGSGSGRHEIRIKRRIQ
jgi:hypothetical protein